MAVAKRGGLFVASAAVCLVLMSATTSVQLADAKLTVDTASLRGGRGALIPSSIHARRLDEGQGEQNENEEEDQQQDQQEEEQQEEQEENEEEQEEKEEEQGENGAENDDENGNGNRYNDIVNSAKDTAQDLMDRFDEDVINMWSTSPSEWNDEHWKVFGIIAGVVTVLMSCIIYVCCACCSGGGRDNKSDFIVATKSQAEGRRRYGWSRSQTGDDETEHTRNTTNDWESPFVLIEDTEKDGAPAPLYPGEGSTYDALSPMSSKTEKLPPDVSTRAVGSPESKGTFRGSRPAPTLSTDDNESSHHDRSIRHDPSLGEPKSIVSETVEVWSEFLGFKKSKYNIPPRAETEDEDINLTDDEKTKRRGRTRPSTKRNSSKPDLARSAEKPPRASTSQMRTGSYSKPDFAATSSEAVETGDEEPSTADESENKYSAVTPVVSNSATERKPNSPRRTALLKTKNLLRSFGNSKTRSSHSRRSDHKETSLLNDSEFSDTV